MKNTPPFLTHPLLDMPHIKHGFFTRHGGVSQGLYDSLNGGLGSKDDLDHVAENRTLAARALGGDQDLLCGLYQIHSDKCLRVDQAYQSRQEGDAIVTTEIGITCIILTADCVPVLFADHKNKVIAAAHAGWRGAVHGILESTTQAMVDAGAELNQIKAVAGPAIQQSSYQVGDDLRDEVCAITSNADQFFIADDTKGHWRFDLPGYVKDRLHKLGLDAEAMTEDTYADDRFFSHREATHKKRPDSGRLMSMIRLPHDDEN